MESITKKRIGSLFLKLFILVELILLVGCGGVKGLKSSAERGNVDAQFEMGSLYFYGGTAPSGLGIDGPSSGQGFLQFNIVSVGIKEGKKVSRDYKEAVKWWRKAAQQGHVMAQNNLGTMYSDGKGVAQDYKEAFKWYRKAAEQNNALAQGNLGVMYYFGQGVPPNSKKAVKWWRKAAVLGNSDAQYNLGIMYWKGHGLPQDKREAYAWIHIAARQGHELAKKARGTVARSLNIRNLSEAQSLSIEYFKKYVEPFVFPETKS